MNWQPTCELRWVNREKPFAESGYLYMATVLQQKWISPFVGEESQWRDIQVEKEA